MVDEGHSRWYGGGLSAKRSGLIHPDPPVPPGTGPPSRRRERSLRWGGHQPGGERGQRLRRASKNPERSWEASSARIPAVIGTS